MYLQRNKLTEVRPHEFVADASDLGWRPGEWPEQLENDLGSGQPLLRGNVRTLDGSVVEVQYYQEFGCARLVVYND